MTALTVTLRNSRREPLDDTTRILIYRQPDRRLVVETTIDRPVDVAFEDLSNAVHHVRAFPAKHRPAAAFAWPGNGITLHCPVKPECVRGIQLGEIDDGFDRVIGNVSIVEKKLMREELAGALNLWAKLKATRLGSATAADYVKAITRIQPDRIWFRPSAELLELVRSSDDVEKVSGKLHGLAGHRVLESYKTRELYGNLQLTFLESASGELVVDADIDEARGLLHLFHVLEHTVTGSSSDPYDIHEILTFYQALDTGYRLIV